MTQSVLWNDASGTPIGMTLDQLLYRVRRKDGDEGLIFDSLTMAEILEDADEVFELDALVTTPAKMTRTLRILERVMNTAGSDLSIAASQVSKPFRRAGVIQVAVIFELSDGQTVTIMFHNPSAESAKAIKPTDDLISWKWMLNKRDITIVVAPERGRDQPVRQVASRIMKLAEKNSAAFARQNAKRAERLAYIDGLKNEITELEVELNTLLKQIEIANIEAEDKALNEPKPVTAKQGLEILDGLRAWLSRSQYRTMADAIRGEEGAGMIDRAKALASIIEGMAKTYEQDGKGMESTAYLHYFKGGSDAYITEKDAMGQGTEQAFGWVNHGHGGELGYVSIDELTGAGMELDLHFDPKTLSVAVGSQAAPTASEAPTAPEQSGEIDLVEAIGERAVIERFAVKAWIGRFGEEGARMIHESSYDKMGVFAIISGEIMPNKELMDAINADRSLTHYWEAKAESVKALSDQAFKDLLASGKEGDSKEKTRVYGYYVLRHSTRAAEHRYIASLGRMRNQARINSQSPGGKLFNMVQPYIGGSRPEGRAQEAKPEVSNVDQNLLEVENQGAAIFDALELMGWTVNADTDTAKIDIGGADGGMLNPDGKRIVIASFKKDDGRWMDLHLGWDEVHTQRIANFPTARKFAEALTEAAFKAGQPKASDAEISAAIETYINAWAEEAKLINEAVDAVDWDAITDIRSATAQEVELRDRVNELRPIHAAKKTLEALGIETWDERLNEVSSTDGFAAHKEAYQRSRDATDRMRKLGAERLKGLGAAELAALPDDAPLEDVARAIFRKHGIDMGDATEGRIASIVPAIQDKDAAMVRGMIMGGHNQASREVFERATGIKLGRTQKARGVQIDEWAGISESDRARIDAEKAAAFKAETLKRNVEYAWHSLGYANIKTSGGEVLSGQDYLLNLMGQGYNEIGTRKRGAATIYGLLGGGRLASVSGREFNTFLKAAQAFGGLVAALNMLGVKLPDAPADVAEEPVSEAAAAAHDEGQTVDAIAKHLEDLGWHMSDKDERGDIIAFLGGMSVGIGASPEGQIDYDGEPLDKSMTAKEAANHIHTVYRYGDEDVNRDRLGIDDTEGYEPGDDHDINWHSPQFNLSALVVKDEVERRGGVITFGDFNGSMSGGLFDSVSDVPYGICAQISFDGKGVGRVAIEEDGSVLIYSGLAGDAVVLVDGEPAQMSAEAGKITAMVGALEEATPSQPSEKKDEADLEYSDQGLFTMFLANTPSGQEAWNQLAEHTDGTGKVLSIHADAIIKQLRDSGYTVRKAKKVAPPTDAEIDELLSKLGNPEPEAPTFSVGDAIEWRNENGAIAGTYRGPVDDVTSVIMVGGMQMNAPTAELFAASEPVEPEPAPEPEPIPEPAPEPAADPMELARQAIESADFKATVRDFGRSLATIAGIDAGTVLGMDRALFVSSITNKIRSRAKRDEVLGGVLLAWLDEQIKNMPRAAVTKRNGIWALTDWEQYSELFNTSQPQPEPQPVPAPEPEPAEPDSEEETMRKNDRQFLQSVIDGTAPDMLSPELADQILAVMERQAGDSEIESLIERAGTAYENAMLSATEDL